MSLAPSSGVAAQPLGATDDGTPAPGSGSIACYLRAGDVVGLEGDKALQLCVGAATVAPARCYAEAVDRLAFTDLEAVRLCTGARSTQPAICAARLESMGLVDNEVVAYCAALDYPFVPAPGRGSPRCVRAGLDRTFLTEGDVLRLCRGSDTTDPIDCFALGDRTTFLAADDLVTLCAPVVMSAPTPYGIAPYGPR